MVKRSMRFVLCAMLAFGLAFAFIGCSQETYEPEGKEPTITTPTISKDGVLRVGVDTSTAPFAGQGSGKISGLNVDIAAAIADELGLQLEVVDVGSNVDGSLTDKTVDIVMGVDKSDTSLKCWKSDTYLESGVALFAASDDVAIPTPESKPKIAAQTSSMSSWEVTDQFGSDCLVATSDLKTAFTQIGSGSVQYVAADAIIGSYAAKISNSEASIIAMLQNPSGYSVGVLDSNTDLKSAISGALESLTDQGIIDVIESKWLGSPVDLSDVPLSPTVKATANQGSGSNETEESTNDTTTTPGTGTNASNTDSSD